MESPSPRTSAALRESSDINDDMTLDDSGSIDNFCQTEDELLRVADIESPSPRTNAALRESLDTSDDDMTLGDSGPIKDIDEVLQVVHDLLDARLEEVQEIFIAIDSYSWSSGKDVRLRVPFANDYEEDYYWRAASPPEFLTEDEFGLHLTDPDAPQGPLRRDHIRHVKHFFSLNWARAPARMAVNAKMPYVMHGYDKPTDGDPCTLVVFTFHISAGEIGKGFRAVHITASFGPYDRTCSKSPVIIDMSPCNTKQLFWSQHRISTSKSIDVSTTLSIAQSSVAGLDVKPSWSKVSVEETTRVDCVRVAGDILARGSCVYWDLIENASAKTGVPSFIQTAVLLKRRRNEAWFQNEMAKLDLDSMSEIKMDEPPWGFNDQWAAGEKV
ncbi:hypothetical protein VTJ04DRAFT_4498 [Mycothermus thermophilus]|uniref:uncharacterized protein n=1 Tax=Humicola insolens TaxID=85995 RepID=UPI003741FFE0